MARFEIPVAEAIETLRSELQQATRTGRGKDLRFKVEDLELELQTVVTREAMGEGWDQGEDQFLVAQRGGVY